MLTFITLPTDFATSTLNIAGGLVGDLSVLLYVVIGVLLGAAVITILISVLRHH